MSTFDQMYHPKSIEPNIKGKSELFGPFCYFETLCIYYDPNTTNRPLNCTFTPKTDHQLSRQKFAHHAYRWFVRLACSACSKSNPSPFKSPHNFGNWVFKQGMWALFSAKVSWDFQLKRLLRTCVHVWTKFTLYNEIHSHSTQLLYSYWKQSFSSQMQRWCFVCQGRYFTAWKNCRMTARTFEYHTVWCGTSQIRTWRIQPTRTEIRDWKMSIFDCFAWREQWDVILIVQCDSIGGDSICSQIGLILQKSEVKNL